MLICGQKEVRMGDGGVRGFNLTGVRSGSTLAHQARQEGYDLGEKYAQDDDREDRQEVGQNRPRDFFEGLLGDRRQDKKDVAEGGRANT